MLQLNDTLILNVIAHGVENKTNGGALFTSIDEIALDEKTAKELTKHFIRPFAHREDFFHFTHGMDIRMNEVFVAANAILEGEHFVVNTSHIAKHLFASTKHHAIKDGELIIALLDGLVYDNRTVSAVGIFKSEKKQKFFKLKSGRSVYDLELDAGIGQYKVDKACLIINTDVEDGFKVLTYEHNGLDAEYWKNEFLSVTPCDNNFSKTNNLIEVYKEFVQEQVELPKFEKMAMMNRTAEVLSANDFISVSNFTEEVFPDPAMQKSFMDYQTERLGEDAISQNEEITVSKYALKKQQRHFKSVLKLDKNFHIYIHGDRGMIEQGIDERGKKFYKLFYDEEN